jgi:hypothetical protein
MGELRRGGVFRVGYRRTIELKANRANLRFKNADLPKNLELLMTDFTWVSIPEVKLGTNTFRDVPIILQYEDDPLIEFVTSDRNASEFTAPIFDGDGEKLGVLKGAQLYLTEPGKKADLKLRHHQDVSAIELGGQTLMELRRNGAAAVALEAELFAPTGYLIRGLSAQRVSLVGPKGEVDLGLGGPVMGNSVFTGCQIGIRIRQNRVDIGLGGGSIAIGNLGPRDNGS